ncbi:hypothetical protein RhiirA1_463308 [Rhizophagus irregularis]|uniref:Uncharacterized protein n=1 Tax=Rhizophagus irregularis TaxID=588596 RepID=A0A2I1E0P2_9GLOM|nr:hypothetical protein RhiirA1_463308 [Rhizophagus irregularis]PKY15696.1 hypothetical protein RhiirB3_427933 [Rhizophagus irregularis]PKY26692.1 hypothetical protein RhiirB3_442090 [Rhizophagus irregularis]
MALQDILRNVGTALDQVENYIDGVDTTFNPKNTLNGIRISLTTVRDHMQRYAQDAINLQGLLYIANGQINNLMNDLTNTRNDVFQRTQLLNLTYNNEANEHHRWYLTWLNSIGYGKQGEYGRSVAGFNVAARTNVMKGKMTERFHPVPANDPYTAGNLAINTEPLFLGFMNEKFTVMDMADTYEKRVKPYHWSKTNISVYVQGISYADAIEYLYGYMLQYIEIRLRQANPANLDTLPIIQSPKDDFKIRLARDLAYSGIVTDDATLENFIYEDRDPGQN